jgi:hypothetical protein
MRERERKRLEAAQAKDDPAAAQKSPSAGLGAVH